MEQTVLKIAVPASEDGTVSEHFGHCKQFAIHYVSGKNIDKVEFLEPPTHVPGAFPKFLGEHGANVIIASGMGSRAVDLFNAEGIDVVLGATGKVEDNVKVFLEGNLESTGSACTH